MMTLPAALGVDYREYERADMLSGDWVITSDWHIPYFDPDMIDLAVERARAFDVHNLLIAGDFLNLSYLSSFDTWYEAHKSSIDEDAEVSRSIIEQLLRTMDRIVIIPTNHERRMQRSLQYSVSHQKMMELFLPACCEKKVTITHLPYVLIETSGGIFRVTHPKSFRINVLSVANRIALVKRQHVISAHGHRFGVALAEDGEHVVADSGGMFDRYRIDYLFLDGDTTHGEWAQGFLVLKNGRIYPISRHIG